MKPAQLTALALILAGSQTLAADCTAPEKPTVPEGGSATMDQMLEGQKAVKTYQETNLEYMKCLEPAMAEAKLAAEQGEDAALERYTAAQEAYNAAVSAEEEVAGEFNTQIRAYKAANPN